MTRTAEVLIDIPWLVLVIYWALGALNTRKTATRESFLSRYSVMFLVVAGYVLLFSKDANVGLLARHFVPSGSGSLNAGIIMTWLGVTLALWARYHLGQYWSGRITIKEGHQLIRTGPYARLRHPIYSGILLAMAGTALAVGQWRCVLGFGLVMVAYCIKAVKEERLLSGQFGDAFQEHRRHTGFLLPRFR